MTIDFNALAQSLLKDAAPLLRQWLPSGRQEGKEYRVGSIRGEVGKSLSVNMETGVWKDFSEGTGGSDLISLYAAIHDIGQKEAAEQLGAAEKKYLINQKCSPVLHYKHGKPSHVFEYTTPKGDAIGYVYRFENNGKKEFKPYSCWKQDNGSIAWEWKRWATKTYPYRIYEATQNPVAKILIVEGEKKADHAQKFMPSGWVVVGWPFGAEAVLKTEWKILKDRECWIWPDNDAPGLKAAKNLLTHLPHVQIITPPADKPEGWDLGNAPENFDIAPFLQKTSVAIKEPDLVLVMGNSNNTHVIINGKEIKGVAQKSIHNVLTLAETDKAMCNCLEYNIFADDVFFVKCPPWEYEESFKVHPLREDELLNFRAWVDTRGLVVGKNDAHDILIALARRNTKNPPRDYFETLKWDGTSRLDTWLTYYLGAEEQELKYLQLVGSKWLIAAVSRIYEPGCKFDNVLILEGEQYLGKSRALELLATINGERYFTDEGVDFKGNNKDSLLKLQGKLIFEMPELASFRKAETDEIKSFIARRIDEYRPLYARKVQPRPRMFVMAGTVNPMGGYLTDPTGNRRYWPVKCGTKLDLAALERDKQQLWSEAIYRYKKGEQIWLEQEEHDMACIEQSERMIEDIITDKVMRHAEGLSDISLAHDFFLTELIDKLDIPIIQQDGKFRSRITGILVANGYREYKPRVKESEKYSMKKQKRKWKRPETRNEAVSAVSG